MTTRFNTGLPASSTLRLQCCRQCRQVNYPPRELCSNCLADDLHWEQVNDRGVLQARVELHYSLEQVYTAHLPWTVGSIRLDCGPVVLAHLQPDIDNGAAVRVSVAEDSAGNRMLVALGSDEDTRQAASGWLNAIDFREVST